jgi:hypothetical protein
MRQLLMAAGRKWLGCRHDDHLYRLGHCPQSAAGRRWTVLLSLVAFLGGALVTLPLLLL